MRCKFSLIFLLVSQLAVYGQEKLYNNEFSLSDVKLLDGPFQDARDLNIKVLLKYDVDGLLAGYRKEANLPEKAKRFTNWDGLDGHVGGHYLSALAMNYAATNNTECKKRIDYMLAELKACQDANGVNNPEWAKGYVGAWPKETPTAKSRFATSIRISPRRNSKRPRTISHGTSNWNFVSTGGFLLTRKPTLTSRH
jgi:DUF1680 family protein